MDQPAVRGAGGLHHGLGEGRVRVDRVRHLRVAALQHEHTCARTDKPLIPTTTISHGTLASIDLQESRRFYEEVLGFAVIQLSPLSMLLRLGTDHVYVVVETGEPGHMGVLDHNGIDVANREEVEEAHRALVKVKDEYGIRRINNVMDQHGVYSFYFQDRDANWWDMRWRSLGCGNAAYGQHQTDN